MNAVRNWQVSINDPLQVVKDAEDIAQCIYIILTTIPGSDPLRPTFGSDVYKQLDRPISEAAPSLVYAAMTAIAKWEPRIKVKKCFMDPDGMDGSRLVIISESLTIKMTL